MGSPVELVDHAHDALLPPTFGASLRAARLSRNISLDTVAARTKINRTFFQDLERDDLSKWPSGQFYRESYLRAYAKAIGLNPRDVIDGFRREFVAGGASNPARPPAKPRRLTPVTIPIILAVTLAGSYSLARWRTPVADVPEAQTSAIDTSVATPPTGASSATAPKVEPSPPQKPAPQPPNAPVTEPVDPGPIEGELVITSTPPGVQVLVNGIGRGRTPVRVQYLPPGSYSIRFIHPGRPSVTQRATISTKHRSVEVSASLELEEPVSP